VERLDNVRQISGECFMRILKLQLPVTEHAENWQIKNMGMMEELFFAESGDEHNSWSDGGSLFPKAVEILEIPEYRRSVLSGLVMSVATRTGSTQRPAATSLAGYTKKLRLTGVSEEQYSLSEFASDLVGLVRSNRASNNVVIPVLHTFNMLFEEDALASLSECERGAACIDALLSICCKNVLRVKNIQRLQESMKIVINLWTLPSVAKACLSTIAEFLEHPYPRVRSSTAEQLYIVLQSKDLGWEPDERVEEMLVETEWSSEDVDKVKDMARGVVDALGSGMNAS